MTANYCFLVTAAFITESYWLQKYALSRLFIASQLYKLWDTKGISLDYKTDNRESRSL